MKKTLKKTVWGMAAVMAATGCVSVSAQHVVELKDGSRLKGRIIEQVWGGNVKLEERDGSIWVIEGSRIEKVEADPTYQAVETSASSNDAQVVGGTDMPEFAYERVRIDPGKKKRRWRYVGGGYILTSEEFYRFISARCEGAKVCVDCARKMENAGNVVGAFASTAGGAILRGNAGAQYSQAWAEYDKCRIEKSK